MTANGPAGVRYYLPFLDFVRIFAFSLISYYHLTKVEEHYFADSILTLRLFNGISGVDIFFILSGFMMGRLFLSVPTERRKTAYEFVVDRISRIYPLYWFVTTALVIVYFWRPDLVYSSRTAVEPDLVKTYLLWPDKALPLHAVAWTLTHLMYFNIVTAIMFLIKPRYYVIVLVLWAIGTMVAHAFWDGSKVPELALIGNVFTLDYILGMTMGLLPALGWNKSKYIAIASLSWILAVMIYAGVTDQVLRALPGYLRFVVVCPAPALLIYSIASYKRPMAAKQGILSLPAIARAGYALYLTHVISFTLLGRLFARFDLPGVVDNVVILLIIIAASFAASMIVERYFEAPMGQALRKLLLRKKQA